MPTAMMKVGMISMRYTYRFARIRYADDGFMGHVTSMRNTAHTQWRKSAPRGVGSDWLEWCFSRYLRKRMRFSPKNLANGRMPSFAISCFARASVNVMPMTLAKLLMVVKMARIVEA